MENYDTTGPVRPKREDYSSEIEYLKSAVYYAPHEEEVSLKQVLDELKALRETMNEMLRCLQYTSNVPYWYGQDYTTEIIHGSR